jgi:aromatic-amino-acid transaminase
MAPSDPILGVTEAFVADQNPRKVNLGVGVYTDDAGKIPLLECVRHAESERLKSVPHRGYLPIDGLGAYDKAVQELVFGSRKENIVTVQALGGTGGLRIGADLLKRINPDAAVWISDPSWENHRQLFEAAGFTVNNYPYYDSTTHGLDFPAMRAALEGLAAGSIVVLHGCCHNPTGVDLTQEQWQGGPGDRALARPRAVPRPRLPGLRREPRSRRLRRASLRRGDEPGVPLQLVLQVLLALRRAGGRAQCRHR